MSEARLYTGEEIEQILDRAVVEVRREMSGMAPRAGHAHRGKSAKPERR